MQQASEPSDVSIQNTGVSLPQDVVEEILLRVPARQLCRFRTVSRSWRYLLSDPSFVKAHAALRPALVLALTEDANRIDVVDLSGSVVKQIHFPAADEESLLPTHPGPAFLFRANKRVRMVDPDTGAVFTLPFDDHDNPTPQRSLWSTSDGDYVLGRDNSTGHLKVLRVVTRVISRSVPFKQVSHVLTLRGGDDSQQPQRWRLCPSPLFSIRSKIDFPGVTIQGFIYFLAGYFFATFDFHRHDAVIDRDMKFVVSFDLVKEQWTTFQLPTGINTGSGRCRMKLVKLSNTLAMAHYNSYHSNIDLWFAQDLEKSLWVKKHCIQQGLLVPSPTSPERQVTISLPNKVYLLMELNDGRIMFSYYVTWTREGARWRTRVYDPRTKACTDLPQLDLCSIVSVYKESLPYLVKW